MPRTCLACSHPDRAAIDKALATESYRNVAKRCGISYSSLFRHKDHIATAASAAAGDGETPQKVIGAKSFSSLPPRKQKYIEGLAEGKTKVQAALDAGYSAAMARSAAHSIETREVRAAFAELMRKRIPPEKIVQRIEEGMDAMETKFFQKDGQVKQTVEVIAWAERREYTEMAAEYGGYAPSRDDERGDSTNLGMAITVETIGAEPDPLIARAKDEGRLRTIEVVPSNGDEVAPVAPVPSDETERGPSQSSPQPSSSALLPPPANQSNRVAIVPPEKPKRRFPLTRTGAAMAFLRGGGSR